jgi:hypothetical protein
MLLQRIGAIKAHLSTSFVQLIAINVNNCRSINIMRAAKTVTRIKCNVYN